MSCDKQNLNNVVENYDVNKICHIKLGIKKNTIDGLLIHMPLEVKQL